MMRFVILRQTIRDVKKVHENIEERSDFREYRIAILQPTTMHKVAFDTRRINQETDYNPRRNLQFYHRSEEFMNEQLMAKIKNLLKIKTATDMIKSRFGKEPEWLDSYARVLHAALDRVLRTEQQDGDFSLAQMNYINELLYMRYRLPEEQIIKLNEQELEKIILSKDEPLAKKELFLALAGTQQIVKTTDNATSMFERLLSEVKASKDSKDVERSITLTVRDKINDAPIEKQSKKTKGEIEKESEEK